MMYPLDYPKGFKKKKKERLETVNIPIPVSLPFWNSAIMQKFATMTMQLCSKQHLHFKYHQKLNTSLQPTLSKI